jgi:hypothetical protein
VSVSPLEQEARYGAGRRRFLKGGEIGAPGLPESGVIRNRPKDNITNSLGPSHGESTDSSLLDQSNIPFFLPRDNVTYEEGDLRCDGFLHRCAPCLSDEKMVRGHQAGHLFGPAKEGTVSWQATVTKL